MDCDNDDAIELNDLEKHCLKSLCPVTYLFCLRSQCINRNSF